MPYVKVTLFDTDNDGNIAGEPVHVEATFKYDIMKPHRKVTVTVADDSMAVAGTVVLPFEMLGRLVEEAVKLKSGSGLLVPKTGIIVPN
jgi:hypothetical protein